MRTFMRAMPFVLRSLGRDAEGLPPENGGTVPESSQRPLRRLGVTVMERRHRSRGVKAEVQTLRKLAATSVIGTPCGSHSA